jgi:hypothetical protein
MSQIPSPEFGNKFEFTSMTPKVSKVIRIHPGKNTIDVVCLDGAYLRGIPVQVPWGSTVSGLVKSIAPTVDPNIPVQPTYPTDFLVEPATLAQPPSVHDDPPLTGNRDIYAVIQQFEGFAIGTSGFICTGFLYGPQGEMRFPVDTRLDDFQDFQLERHESDLQITTDKTGAHSIQHPSGARITLAEEYVATVDKTVDPAESPVNLTHLDANQLYEIRNNKTRKVKAVVRDSFGSRVVLNADGSFTVDNPAGVSVVGNADGSCDITAPGNINVVSENESIGLKAAKDITLEAGAGIGLKAGTDIALETDEYDTSVNDFINAYNLFVGDFDIHAHLYIPGEGEPTYTAVSVVPPSPDPKVLPLPPLVPTP